MNQVVHAKVCCDLNKDSLEQIAVQKVIELQNERSVMAFGFSDQMKRDVIRQLPQGSLYYDVATKSQLVLAEEAAIGKQWRVVFISWRYRFGADVKFGVDADVVVFMWEMPETEDII